MQMLFLLLIDMKEILIHSLALMGAEIFIIDVLMERQ
jgi:hypothetical protein